MVLSPPVDPARSVGEILTAAKYSSDVTNAVNFLANKPKFQVRVNSAAFSIPNGVATTVKWDTIDADTYSGYSASTGNYTVPSGLNGRWVFKTWVTYASNAAGVRGVVIIINGISMPFNWNTGATDAFGRCSAAAEFDLGAGATIAVQTIQTSGAALNLSTGYGNVFAGHWESL